MRTTPKSLRLHIALFGRTNVGKSSFLNLVTGQSVSIVSNHPGTTTDVVEKTMELLPIGPVVFLDTAGLDDVTALGRERVAKAARVFERADIILLICEGENLGEYERSVERQAREKSIPVIFIGNKADCYQTQNSLFLPCNSLNINSRNHVLTLLKAELINKCPDDFISPPPLVGNLIPLGGLVVLIVPIDIQAPKGRLILPQVSTIRDILDHDASVLVVKETEYAATIKKLGVTPDLVICDSQVVRRMVDETPEEIPCTTFSILFARLKGDLETLAAGTAAINTLKSGDKVLIAESCSHHEAEDDIGRIKIPKWLKQFCKCELDIDVYAGHDFPENLNQYSLVVQCGGCMHNRRTMLSRIEKSHSKGVPITNYGLCISHTQGVLDRVLSPFPAARDAFKRMFYEN